MTERRRPTWDSSSSDYQWRPTTGYGTRTADSRIPRNIAVVSLAGAVIVALVMFLGNNSSPTYTARGSSSNASASSESDSSSEADSANDSNEGSSAESSSDSSGSDGQSGSGGSTSSDPTPEAAMAMSAKQATARLESLNDEGWSRLYSSGSSFWVPQVSSKCAGLESVDIQDSSGRLGFPDGQPERFSNGVGNKRILAFHYGMARRLGVNVDELSVLTPSDLGLRTDYREMCGSTTMWISLLLNEEFQDKAGALRYCENQGLPFGECAARKLGPEPKFALPLGDQPSRYDADTYPVIVNTYLIVRSKPNTNGVEVGRVPKGGYVTIECTVSGQAIDDPYGRTINRWGWISKPFEGYVSEAFVDTGGVRPDVPYC